MRIPCRVPRSERCRLGCRWPYRRRSLVFRVLHLQQYHLSVQFKSETGYSKTSPCTTWLSIWASSPALHIDESSMKRREHLPWAMRPENSMICSYVEACSVTDVSLLGCCSNDKKMRTQKILVYLSFENLVKNQWSRIFPPWKIIFS